MRNEIRLTATEARVIGSLIEKEITTPDQYPLSMNALKLACNQKSSRDPIMSLGDEDVREALDHLSRKHLVLERSGFGSRVPKFKQRFCNTEFSSLQFSEQERGIVCALLLRGAQTPGQLRTHTHRLCEFSDADEVEETLRQLMERPDGPFVAKLPREPGKRESRFMHLFGDPAEALPDSEDPEPVIPRSEMPDRDPLQDLERRVAVLEQQLAALQARIQGPDGD
jgi:uncharacterized protein YceH (UPF0502 family)